MAKKRTIVEDLTLQEMLALIDFRSLEVVQSGDGWVGTRYILRSYNYGSSHVCKDLEEVRQWIINHLAWQLTIPDMFEGED